MDVLPAAAAAAVVGVWEGGVLAVSDVGLEGAFFISTYFQTIAHSRQLRPAETLASQKHQPNEGCEPFQRSSSS